MIQSKKDLHFYMQEDTRVNIGKTHCTYIEMLFRLWYGDERYCFLNYMGSLRKLEYAMNCSRGIIGIFRCLYQKIRWRRLGLKYNLLIHPNMVGYGFRMPHIVGGGYN